MVIQVNQVFQEQKVKMNWLKIKDIDSFFRIGERGLRGAPGAPGNSTATGGFPGPQGRMYFFIKQDLKENFDFILAVGLPGSPGAPGFQGIAGMKGSKGDRGKFHFQMKNHIDDQYFF